MSEILMPSAPPPARVYGWLKELPKLRSFRKPTIAEADLPDHVDFREEGLCPPVYDQKQLGSCTANAAAAAVQILCIKAEYKWPFTPSRLFIYYNNRDLEGTTWIDSGATIADTVKALNLYGVCPEDGGNKWSWPYSDDQIHFRMKPPSQCYKDALLHRALEVESIALDRHSIQEAIANRMPVMIGIAVYESFESAEVAKTGNVPVPDPSKERMLGGHALCIVGYDRPTDIAIVRNSWSDRWGDKGYCKIPFPYLCNPDLAADFAAVQLVGFRK